MQQVKYLGLKIDCEGVRSDEERIKDFRLWKDPTNKINFI